MGAPRANHYLDGNPQCGLSDPPTVAASPGSHPRVRPAPPTTPHPAEAGEAHPPTAAAAARHLAPVGAAGAPSSRRPRLPHRRRTDLAASGRRDEGSAPRGPTRVGRGRVRGGLPGVGRAGCGRNSRGAHPCPAPSPCPCPAPCPSPSPCPCPCPCGRAGPAGRGRAGCDRNSRGAHPCPCPCPCPSPSPCRDRAGPVGGGDRPPLPIQAGNLRAGQGEAHPTVARERRAGYANT